MEGSSSINNGWRICILASFIGGIILVFCLNHSRNDISLSTVQSSAATAAPSNTNEFNTSAHSPATAAPSNSNEFNTSVHLAVPVAPSDINELSTSTHDDYVKKKPVEIKKEECNIFDGEWIYNPKESPLYNGHQCPFLSDQVSCQRNGQPEIDYQKWSWEGKGLCQIPRFNATDMLKRLKGKRVIIVGDSLNRNQWESLACLLYSAISPSRAHVDIRSGTYKVFKALDYHCSVEFYWSPFLVQLETNQKNGRRNNILKLDEVSNSAKKWKGAHIMVFNTGHWWVHRGKIKAWDLFQRDGKLVENMELELAFGIAMNTWAHWINKHVDKTITRVFFRNMSPEHKGTQWCYNRTQPMKDESFITTFPKSIIGIVEKTIGGMRTPVKYLNITKLSQYRIDAHPAIYARKQKQVLIAKQQRQPESYADCSHWCLPGVPDTWNRLLYASMVDNS
ncbi:hypothetical protein Patl1_02416 [Pistacia atlantica]|uniref:Uncharacterized protein n=1 Tax=Pistacia atlantica TaxID=434234 RepID=A0ACC1C6V8_9ROSI|nr:hypothetical protein Patl1_02416 [Pistacia atlantica]